MNNHSEPRELSTQEKWDLAQQNRPIDRSEIGITTPRTYDGLEVFNDGFDIFGFLKH